MQLVAGSGGGMVQRSAVEGAGAGGHAVPRHRPLDLYLLVVDTLDSALGKHRLHRLLLCSGDDGSEARTVEQEA